MDYLLTFVEGIITFVSPCLLPMLPVYLFYFTGQEEERRSGKTLLHALAFVLGFTTVFLALGLFSALLGGLLSRHQTLLNVITGGIVVLFGLSYLGLFGKTLFAQGGMRGEARVTGLLSAYAFGLVFSISWTPCVGAFLGSALMLASRSGSAAQGALLLLCYSAGLGIPFVLSALLIDRLKGAFDWIKRNYGVITRASGLLLVLIGLAMAFGLLGRLLALLS
ncbi:MAG: cytochrome c biogenesis protein CcdA [Clostridiales bacterium]|nr:cytochrome c biogenesis protein CcdA [Clostridiales bacterium]